MEVSRRRSVSMSRTWGMFSRTISPSVRMAAAMHGSAEFFAPETLMVPRRGLPPRTTNLSIGLVYGSWRWRWVTAVVQRTMYGCAAMIFELSAISYQLLVQFAAVDGVVGQRAIGGEVQLEGAGDFGE